MCGIVGYFNVARPERYPGLLERMCNTISHRGPDDAGVFEDGRIGLGVRRLSIIDLPGGHQPMSSDDGSAWIAFNGEAYNYQDLRACLEKQGCRFRTHSDTEVILQQYREEGKEC